MIVLFHRPPFDAVESEPPAYGDYASRRKDTFSVQSLSLTEDEAALYLDLTAVWRYRHNLKMHADIEKKVGSVYELFYNCTREQVVLRDYRIVNPYAGKIALGQADETIPIGRVHFEDGRVLIYVRSHYADVDGVENVVMEDENKSSVYYMSQVSDEAAAVFNSVFKKRSFLNEVDTLDSVSYLEAQLDVLTKVVLLSGIADNDELRDVLTAADECAIWRYNTKDKLLGKMSDKAEFREKQLKYYADRETNML